MALQTAVVFGHGLVVRQRSMLGPQAEVPVTLAGMTLPIARISQGERRIPVHAIYLPNIGYLAPARAILGCLGEVYRSGPSQAARNFFIFSIDCFVSAVPKTMPWKTCGMPS